MRVWCRRAAGCVNGGCRRASANRWRERVAPHRCSAHGRMTVPAGPNMAESAPHAPIPCALRGRAFAALVSPHSAHANSLRITYRHRNASENVRFGAHAFQGIMSQYSVRYSYSPVVTHIECAASRIREGIACARRPFRSKYQCSSGQTTNSIRRDNLI